MILNFFLPPAYFDINLRSRGNIIITVIIVKVANPNFLAFHNDIVVKGGTQSPFSLKCASNEYRAVYGTYEAFIPRSQIQAVGLPTRGSQRFGLISGVYISLSFDHKNLKKIGDKQTTFQGIHNKRYRGPIPPPKRGRLAHPNFGILRTRVQ